MQETPIAAPKVDEPVIIEPTKPLEESQPKDLFEAAKFSSPEIKTPEIKENIEEVIEPIAEEQAEEIQVTKEEDFTTRFLNEISEEDDDEVLDDLDEEEIKEESVIIEAPKKIILDEPRRNIGNSRYDDGYYEFDLTQEHEKKIINGH